MMMRTMSNEVEIRMITDLWIYPQYICVFINVVKKIHSHHPKFSLTYGNIRANWIKNVELFTPKKMFSKTFQNFFQNPGKSKTIF